MQMLVLLLSNADPSTNHRRLQGKRRSGKNCGQSIQKPDHLLTHLQENQAKEIIQMCPQKIQERLS